MGGSRVHHRRSLLVQKSARFIFNCQLSVKSAVLPHPYHTVP